MYLCDSVTNAVSTSYLVILMRLQCMSTPGPPQNKQKCTCKTINVWNGEGPNLCIQGFRRCTSNRQVFMDNWSNGHPSSWYQFSCTLNQMLNKLSLSEIKFNSILSTYIFFYLKEG